jgi:hypothetical protein
MANITFNSETYNAFLAEKKCCIATQVSEYIDAMYSASSDADCLLDELRENIYYLKFLEAGYIPVGDVLYPENGTCQYKSNIQYDYDEADKFNNLISLSYYDENGVIDGISFYFTNETAGIWPPGSIHGGASTIQNYINNYFTGLGYNDVNVSVSFIDFLLNISVSVNGLVFYLISDQTNEIDSNFNYLCDYVYASEDTNCITDDDAIKLSNLMHCDCCN